jgi:hypothetical protein
VEFAVQALEKQKRSMPYEASSSSLVDALEISLQNDGLYEGYGNLLDSLEKLTKVDLRVDLKRNRKLLTLKIEEELIFHSANKTGVFEYLLTTDPNIITSITLLENGEYSQVLAGPNE